MNPASRFDRLVADALIMMVDDEPINMDVLQIHLESAGYSRFMSISDSTKAIEAMERHKPDVVLLDILMPDLDGFEILQLMASRPMLAGIPVIVLTSADSPATKLRALELGATDFLSKPLDASELALRMRNTLRGRSWQLRQTRIDELTELPNHDMFFALLDQECRQNAQSATTSALAVINLNRFKAINLSFGNAGGDIVLWEIREKLIKSFGRNDPALFETLSLSNEHPNCVARLGADRFAVLMTSMNASTVARAAASLVANFLKLLEEPLIVNGKSVFVKASVGIVGVEDDTIDALSLLSEAETAMGHARQRGENVYTFYATEMDTCARQRITLEDGLRTAIDDNEIFLVYQPKLDLTSNTITGAEALVRWNHPTRGLVSPADFISLAEDSGQIVSIGKWVMRESCLQAKRWIDAGLPNFKIAVNVSIRQLHESSFIDTVEEILDETGLAAASLIIELTENMIMENAETNVGKLQRLRDIGVGLSIDDFGTGYSSLAYLQRFPVDQVKIDRSFVSEIVDVDSEVPIVKAIVSLAHDLGMAVVAEGVETRLQLDRLTSLGCEECQGYLISRPVVAEQFVALMHTHSSRVNRAA